MASRPIAPTPAQPSRKVVPSTRAPRMLNSVSLSLSLVGRIPAGGVPLRCLLLNFPEIIRIRISHGLNGLNGFQSVKSVESVAHLTHCHKPRPRRERLNQFLTFGGAINPALRFLLSQRQKFTIRH